MEFDLLGSASNLIFVGFIVRSIGICLVRGYVILFVALFRDLPVAWVDSSQLFGCLV